MLVNANVSFEAVRADDKYNAADIEIPSIAGWRIRTRAWSACAVRFYLAAYHGLKIEGVHHLPVSGPFVLVSNHASHLDALCLRAALPRYRLANAFTMVAEDYFYSNPIRSLSARVFANARPFSRNHHVRNGLRSCHRLLKQDRGVLIFFPEGTRSMDGQVNPFRPGVGALLAGTRWPVVPCAIRGAFTAWPKGNIIDRPARIHVKIGAPRTYQHWAGTHHAYHAVARDVHEAVKELLCS